MSTVRIAKSDCFPLLQVTLTSLKISLSYPSAPMALQLMEGVIIVLVLGHISVEDFLQLEQTSAHIGS